MNKSYLSSGRLDQVPKGLRGLSSLLLMKGLSPLLMPRHLLVFFGSGTMANSFADEAVIGY